MPKAFFIIVVIGTFIGFLMPASPPTSPTAEAASTTRTAKPDKSEPRASNPRETRVSRENDGHFYVDATVNGQQVRFLVDTGATAVALTVDDARRVGASFSPAEFDVVGTGASGAVRGQPITLDRVELDGKRVSDVRGAVVEGLHISLLGQTFLSRMEMVEMSGEEMVIR